MPGTDLLGQLSTSEWSALTSRLVVQPDETPSDALMRLIAVGSNEAVKRANFASLRNFALQMGGPTENEIWRLIRSIAASIPSPLNGRGDYQSSVIQFRVADRDEFLHCLRDDPINRFSVNSFADSLRKTAQEVRGAFKGREVYHAFDNARASTPRAADPQLHIYNELADDPEFGPNFFWAHWDFPSARADENSFWSNLRGAMKHGEFATPEEVWEFLKSLHLC